MLLPKLTKSDTKVDCLVNSLGQDLCLAITNGYLNLPKYIFRMSLRHLFRSAELINMINQLGHSETYSFLLKTETALAMAVENASSLSTINNVQNPSCWSVFHSDFDNYEESISDIGGTRSVHRSHGVILQDIITKEGEDFGGVTFTIR